MDGTGNPAMPMDVGIRDGRIVALGKLEGARAGRTVDARGRLIVPGFIDLHSHADDSLSKEQGLRSPDPHRRLAPNLVSQGITTVVVNQDGRSPWPIADQRALIEQLGTGPNVILLAGHGTVRRQVMGDDFRRPATDEEIDRMRLLVKQAMREGAMGLSAGLEYTPGRWSRPRELIELVREIVPYQGVYISHQRSEGADPMWFWPSQDDPSAAVNLLQAVQETIDIGKLTGATVVASHIKAKGARYWGSGLAAIQLIEEARGQGIDIWADQYPYDTTGSDGSTVLIPGWALARGRDDYDDPGRDDGPRHRYTQYLRRVMLSPEAAQKLRGDIEHEIERRGGASKIVVFEYPNANFVGKTLAELASSAGIDPIDMAIRLQLEGDPSRRGGGRLRGFSLSEVDIELYAAQPWTATASDAGIALPEDGPVHARFYGTFPRKIREYALDRKVVSLEDAIRSCSSLPAQILRLKDRGLIREGYAADLVVLHLENLRDRATFFKPHQYPSGVDWVLVNGEPVVENGRLTSNLPGRIITRDGSSAAPSP